MKAPQKVIIKFQVTGLSAIKTASKELNKLEKQANRLGIPKAQISKLIAYNIEKASK